MLFPMNHTYIPHSFDYPLHTESESFEQIRTISDQPPFAIEDVGHPRPDGCGYGYGSLGGQVMMLQPLSLPSANASRCTTQQPGAQDLPFLTPGFSTSSMNSSCGSTSTSPGSAASSFAISPHTSFLPNGPNTIGSYSLAAQSQYAPTVNYPQAYLQSVPDVKPRLLSIHSSSGMRPPSRSPGNPSPVSPSLRATAREKYTTSTPHLHTHPFRPHSTSSYMSQSPQSQLSTNTRSLDSSNTSYRLSTSSMPQDTAAQLALGSHSAVPFENTKNLHTVTDAKGNAVQPDLQAQIDKGFFKADQDWTCYRRNYFSVACSYVLKPNPYASMSEPLYVHRASAGSTSDLIVSLAMCIVARVDGEDGKVIEIVQHTPKRDRAPTSHPQKTRLAPHPTGSLGLYPGASGALSGSQASSEYDSVYPASSTPQQQQPQSIANFDRLQFKTATANNGKRRAAQQYFHIIVELFAEIASNTSSDIQWLKIASRISAPMVVRGRSPGHYSKDRRDSSASMGPGGGGSSGDSAGGQRDPDSAGPSTGSRSGLSRASLSSSSRIGGGAYTSHHASSTHSPSGSHSIPSSSSSSYDQATHNRTIKRPTDPVLTTEEVSSIEEYPGYQYYPFPLSEPSVNGNTVRPLRSAHEYDSFKSNAQSSSQQQAPFGYLTSSNGHANPRNGEPRGSVKGEYADTQVGSGHHPPHSQSLGNQWPTAAVSDASGRGCGRFQGLATSRGHYPQMSAL